MQKLVVGRRDLDHRPDPWKRHVSRPQRRRRHKRRHRGACPSPRRGSPELSVELARLLDPRLGFRAGRLRGVSHDPSPRRRNAASHERHESHVAGAGRAGHSHAAGGARGPFKSNPVASRGAARESLPGATRVARRRERGRGEARVARTARGEEGRGEPLTPPRRKRSGAAGARPSRDRARAPRRRGRAPRLPRGEASAPLRARGRRSGAGRSRRG